MSRLTQPLLHYLSTNRFALLVFSCLSLITAVVLATTQQLPKTQPANEQMKISSQLSQTKLIQNELSSIYLDVSITAPNIDIGQSEQQASDIIVILDRSGSMSEANKMTYAKAAIVDLLSRLNERDRFALISFANDATVHSALTTVDAAQREQLSAMVKMIHSGGGTNIGAGLISAAQLLAHKQQSRASKVLLLSDGQANQGITDLAGLSNIVAQLTRQESVLSSIGMGLDFNETLMSALADYGMGTYAYLENLSGLGNIFASNLNATRAIFAANSTLQLHLADTIELVDAGGYPITDNGAHHYTVITGQLLSHSDKKFMMTFKVNASETGNIALGKMHLNYQVQGEHYQQALTQEPLMLVVVAPEKRQDAVASIDQDVYKQSILKNNLGRMQKKLSHWLREGNKGKADEVINQYRDDISKAEKHAAMPMASAEMNEALNEMQSSVADVFSGNHMDQDLKRKRAAKSIQMQSIKQQRVSETNP